MSSESKSGSKAAVCSGMGHRRFHLAHPLLHGARNQQRVTPIARRIAVGIVQPVVAATALRPRQRRRDDQLRDQQQVRRLWINRRTTSQRP